MKKFLSCGVLAVVLLVGCDTNHTSEYNRISRYDIDGYEAFIEKYPTSIHVSDALERVEVEKERQRQEEERRRLEEKQQQLEYAYGSNSLPNASQPYAKWYGKNSYYDDYTPHSEIRVKAPYNSDVIAIVRYNNQNGRVAGHRYIQAGNSATIYLKNGQYYQTFFYYGKGWYPDKEMKNGIKGGFIKGEAFSKDGSSSQLDNEILTYELTLQTNGNFQTSSSNENEIF